MTEEENTPLMEGDDEEDDEEEEEINLDDLDNQDDSYDPYDKDDYINDEQRGIAKEAISEISKLGFKTPKGLRYAIKDGFFCVTEKGRGNEDNWFKINGDIHDFTLEPLSKGDKKDIPFIKSLLDPFVILKEREKIMEKNEGFLKGIYKDPNLKKINYGEDDGFVWIKLLKRVCKIFC